MRLQRRRAAMALIAAALSLTAARAADMAQSMQMDDAAPIGKLWFDQLERRSAGPDGAAWQGEGWYGGDYNKAWLRSEGATDSGKTQNARAELFWDHVVGRWWSVQSGVREDFGIGPARGWAGFGIRGLAPQGVDVEATVYAGAAGRTAARVRMNYDLLFTQRLVLTSEFEMNAYGKSDPERAVGSGISDLEVGLRLRYEVRREIAPYAGIVWVRRRGAAAASLTASAADTDALCLAVGLRLWL